LPVVEKVVVSWFVVCDGRAVPSTEKVYVFAQSVTASEVKVTGEPTAGLGSLELSVPAARADGASPRRKRAMSSASSAGIARRSIRGQQADLMRAATVLGCLLGGVPRVSRHLRPALARVRPPE